MRPGQTDIDILHVTQIDFVEEVPKRHSALAEIGLQLLVHCYAFTVGSESRLRTVALLKTLGNRRDFREFAVAATWKGREFGDLDSIVVEPHQLLFLVSRLAPHQHRR